MSQWVQFSLSGWTAGSGLFVMDELKAIQYIYIHTYIHVHITVFCPVHTIILVCILTNYLMVNETITNILINKVINAVELITITQLVQLRQDFFTELVSGLAKCFKYSDSFCSSVSN